MSHLGAIGVGISTLLNSEFKSQRLIGTDTRLVL